MIPLLFQSLYLYFLGLLVTRFKENDVRPNRRNAYQKMVIKGLRTASEFEEAVQTLRLIRIVRMHKYIYFALYSFSNFIGTDLDTASLLPQNLTSMGFDIRVLRESLPLLQSLGEIFGSRAYGKIVNTLKILIRNPLEYYCIFQEALEFLLF